jgi:hypothetical protein
LDEMTPTQRQEISMSPMYQEWLRWVEAQGTLVGAPEKQAFAELFILLQEGKVVKGTIGKAYKAFLKAQKSEEQYKDHTAIAFARNISFWVQRSQRRFIQPGQSPQPQPRSRRDDLEGIPTNSELEDALRRMRDKNPSLYTYALNRFEKGRFAPVVLNLMQDPCHAGQPLPEAPEVVSFTGGN